MDPIKIFEGIVLSSLMGSFLVLLVFIIKWISGNKLSAKFHCYIWVIVLLKLIIPYGPQSPISVFNVYDRFCSQIFHQYNTDDKQQSPAVQLEKAGKGEAVSAGSADKLNEGTAKVYLENRSNIEKLLFFIWLLGAMLLAFLLDAGQWRLKILIKSPSEVVSEAHNQIFEQCKELMGVTGHVDIIYSNKVSGPSVCGIVEAKILIPVDIIDKVSDEEFKYIILHELSHIKDKHTLINLAIILVTIVYWFNPILLYAFYRMRQDCETACDSAVLSYMGDGENVAYGNALLKISSLAASARNPILVTAMAINKDNLKKRIIAISQNIKTSKKAASIGFAICIFLAIIGLTSTYTSKYAHGSTIGEAINYWYDKDLSTIGYAETLAAVDTDKNKKLVFFKSTNNSLMCAYVKKMWNNTWIVTGQGGEIPLDRNTAKQAGSSGSEPTLTWMWTNMMEFGISFGTVLDHNVDRIVVGDREAVILNKDADIPIWYFIDSTGGSYQNFKPNMDIKGYDRDNKPIYSYYPQK